MRKPEGVHAVKKALAFYADAARSIGQSPMPRLPAPMDQRERLLGPVAIDAGAMGIAAIEELDKLRRAVKRLTENIAEFGSVTDPEFIDDVDRLLMEQVVCPKCANDETDGFHAASIDDQAALTCEECDHVFLDPNA